MMQNQVSKPSLFHCYPGNQTVHSKTPSFRSSFCEGIFAVDQNEHRRHSITLYWDLVPISDEFFLQIKEACILSFMI